MDNHKKISKNILLLGVVSFLNDVASEMVYPIVPIFLTTILGAPATIVGIIEGIADAAAKILMAISGMASDRIHKRKLFVGIGYSFSSISHLLMSLANSWPLVLVARVINRTGKGVRTAARDAIISDSVEKANRGISFGIHRTMDDLGGVVGPLLSILFLSWFAYDYRKVFVFAFIPSLLGALIIFFFIKETKNKQEKIKVPMFQWSNTSSAFRIFLLISTVFAIGNSSDVFLVLRSQNLGMSVGLTVFTYVLFNITNSLFSIPAGIIADKVGFKRVMAAGFVIFSLVYFGFGYIDDPKYIWVLFPLYGVFMALTDGVSKAYISRLVPHEVAASAFGIYQTTMGFATLAASVIAGVMWSSNGPRSPFYFGAVMAILAEALFFGLSKKLEFDRNKG